MGKVTADEVAEVLDELWDGPETLFVVSSDLSHYQDDATARKLDAETARAIVGMEEDRVRAPAGVWSSRDCRLPARREETRADGANAGPEKFRRDGWIEGGSGRLWDVRVFRE